MSGRISPRFDDHTTGCTSKISSPSIFIPPLPPLNDATASFSEVYLPPLLMSMYTQFLKAEAKAGRAKRSTDGYGFGCSPLFLIR